MKSIMMNLPVKIRNIMMKIPVMTIPDTTSFTMKISMRNITDAGNRRLRAQGRCMPYVAKIREKSIKKRN